MLLLRFASISPRCLPGLLTAPAAPLPALPYPLPVRLQSFFKGVLSLVLMSCPLNLMFIEAISNRIKSRHMANHGALTRGCSQRRCFAGSLARLMTTPC